MKFHAWGPSAFPPPLARNSGELRRGSPKHRRRVGGRRTCKCETTCSIAWSKVRLKPDTTPVDPEALQLYLQRRALFLELLLREPERVGRLTAPSPIGIELGARRLRCARRFLRRGSAQGLPHVYEMARAE